MESILIKPNPLKSTNQAKELTSFIICLICMFLFLFSAYEKIAEHEIFMTGLANVQVLSKFAIPISWIVPFLEIVISIMLIIPQTQTKGLIAFIGLMGLFTVYIASMWLWASKLPCHCNLIIDQLTWGEHIWFNLAFTGLAVVALLFHSSHRNTLKSKT